MAYTEIKKRNKNKYYYRVVSIRNKDKVAKERIYLGKNLKEEELNEKIEKADGNLGSVRKQKKLKEILLKIRRILIKSNIKKAGIFGSYARGEETKDSDVDILIEPVKNMGIGFVELKLKLEKELGKKVDLVSYKGINPHLKKYILGEEVRII